MNERLSALEELIQTLSADMDRIQGHFAITKKELEYEKSKSWNDGYEVGRKVGRGEGMEKGYEEGKIFAAHIKPDPLK